MNSDQYNQELARGERAEDSVAVPPLNAPDLARESSAVTQERRELVTPAIEFRDVEFSYDDKKF